MHGAVLEGDYQSWSFGHSATPRSSPAKEMARFSGGGNTHAEVSGATAGGSSGAKVKGLRLLAAPAASMAVKLGTATAGAAGGGRGAATGAARMVGRAMRPPEGGGGGPEAPVGSPRLRFLGMIQPAQVRAHDQKSILFVSLLRALPLTH
jgi:hypothetical protein